MVSCPTEFNKSHNSLPVTTLIVAATLAEARPIIDYYKLIFLSNFTSVNIYSNSTIKLVITGIGRFNAVFGVGVALGQFALPPQVIINIGCAGSIIEKDIGGTYIINHIVDSINENEQFLEMILDTGLDERSLLTVSEPSEAKNYADKNLQDSNFLVDMEASAIFTAVTKAVSVSRIVILKIVTDWVYSDDSVRERNQIIQAYNKVAPSILNKIDLIIRFFQIKDHEKNPIDATLKLIVEHFSLTMTQQYELELLLNTYVEFGGVLTELWEDLSQKSTNSTKARSMAFSNIKNIVEARWKTAL